MDKNKSPQDFLNEIFEKSRTSAPPVPPPRFEPPEDYLPPPAPPAGGPGEKAGGLAKLLPWLLCLALGAVLLLGVCLLQLAQANRRLGEEHAALREESGQLRRDLEELREQTVQAEQARGDLLAELAHVAQELNLTAIQKWQRDYLFYIGRFMDSGDYPMAALAVVLSADRYFDPANLDSIPSNQAQLEQYRAYLWELAEKGYLKLELRRPIDSSFTAPAFTEQGDPEQNPDMAALGILWCAMDEYYVQGNSHIAAQFLADSPMKFPSVQALLTGAGEYAAVLYRRIVSDLAADGYLLEEGDGTLAWNPNYYRSDDVDIRYELPFNPAPLSSYVPVGVPE